MISRKFKFADARSKLRYENLKKFRAWMESYRDILKCEYPRMHEFWLSQAIAPPLGIDVTEPKFEKGKANAILYDLKKYKEARRIVDKAGEVGEEAFYTLVDRPSRFNLKARLFYSKEVYTDGLFITAVIEDLKKFHTIFTFLYHSIEKNYAETKIDWDKLDIVSPDNLHEIIIYATLPTERRNLGYVTEEKYYEKYLKLGDALDTINWKKSQASEHSNRIFSIIREYESKWIVPDS